MWLAAVALVLCAWGIWLRRRPGAPGWAALIAPAVFGAWALAAAARRNLATHALRDLDEGPALRRQLYLEAAIEKQRWILYAEIGLLALAFVALAALTARHFIRRRDRPAA